MDRRGRPSVTAAVSHRRERKRQKHLKTWCLAVAAQCVEGNYGEFIVKSILGTANREKASQEKASRERQLMEGEVDEALLHFRQNLKPLIDRELRIIERHFEFRRKALLNRPRLSNFDAFAFGVVLGMGMLVVLKLV